MKYLKLFESFGKDSLKEYNDLLDRHKSEINDFKKSYVDFLSDYLINLIDRYNNREFDNFIYSSKDGTSNTYLKVSFNFRLDIEDVDNFFDELKVSLKRLKKESLKLELTHIEFSDVLSYSDDDIDVNLKNDRDIDNLRELIKKEYVDSENILIQLYIKNN
jgi:hypothetical protein